VTYPLARVDAEIAFTSGSNSGQYLTLDDPVRGKLDVGKLAPGNSAVGGELFEPVSDFLSAVQVNRGATRLDGPLVRYETGNAIMTLRNEDRRFDPTNLDGPYVIGSGIPTSGVWNFRCNRPQDTGHGFTVLIKSDAGTGPAEILSWSSRADGGPLIEVDKPAGLAVGHILVAFQTADYGSLTDMGTPSGGSTWLSLGTRSSSGMTSTKTKVWWKRANAADVALAAANAFDFTQHGFADTTVAIACVRFADATATPLLASMDNNNRAVFATPSLTPAGSDDFELRWVAGTGGGGGASWQRTDEAVGFTERIDIQSNGYTTGALFTRPLVAIGTGETQITPMRAARLFGTWGTEANLVANSMFQTLGGDGGGTLTGWSAVAGTTLASSSDRAYLGGYSARLSKSSGSTFGMVMSSGAYFSSPSGQPVTISAWVYIPASAYSAVTGITISDPTGDAGIVTGNLPKTDTADRWRRVVYSTTVTGGQLRAVQISFTTNNTLGAAAVVAYVDAVQVVTAAKPERFTMGRTRFPLFRGFVDYWEVKWSMENGPLWSETTTPCSDAFKFFTNFTRIAQELSVGAGEDTGQRIHRILDVLGWPDEERAVDAGDSVLQGTTHDGDSLGEMQQAVESELGELYMDSSGKVVFRRRNAVLEEERSTVPQWVFGDDTDNPQELPWSDLAVAYDDTQLYNLVEEAMVGGEVQSVQSAPSRLRNLTRPFSRSDLLLTTDAEVLNHANMILAMSKDPELRFDSLTINAYKDPYRLFPAVLTLRIGDMVRIIRRPPGGGLPIVRDVIIRGIAHDIGQVKWDTVFTLQSATKYSDVVPF
jgi:hypothetical protein